MNFQLKTRKSAGIRVTPRVHAWIAQGNAARSARQWEAAATAYRAAVELDPGLYHIWIQLGHALREAGQGEEGKAAYLRAAALRPRRGEPDLFLGHLAKEGGFRRDAAEHYRRAALCRDEAEDDAARELGGLIPGMADLPRWLLLAILRDDAAGDAADPGGTAGQIDALLGQAPALAPDEADALAGARDLLRAIGAGEAPADAHAAGAPPIVFDITDLIAHFGRSRLPTGIQRVQIEVITAALDQAAGRHIAICTFTVGREGWIGIDRDLFRELARLANASGDTDDPDWQIARGRLFFRLAIDAPFVMPEQARLVNLGTSWWVHDYFRLVREAKARAGIRYVAFVHDLIPIMVPQHCVRGVTEDFVAWTVGAFQHADLFLANSRSTRDDLLRVARRLGHDVDKASVEVVPLDADFRRPAVAMLPRSALAQWGLADEPFVLFVSTIESRKNHVLAFDAWARLIAGERGDAVPRLVCVGRDGWLNDAAFARLRADPALRARVTIIHQVSDDELALLYRACLFSLYPSHYEGWGLPITESLCYGKVPVIADNSSLPEAGGRFALVFESGSVAALADAVTQAAFDHAWRQAREAEIARDYAPRPWADVARQITAAIDRVDGRQADGLAAARTVQPGVYYPTSLYRAMRLWRGLASGEIFRSGDGWLWPETGHCRLRPEGGALSFRVERTDRPLALYLRVAGLAEARCPVGVTLGDTLIGKALIQPGEVRWLKAVLPAGTGPDVTVRVKGHAGETVTINIGGLDTPVAASIALVGFAVCPADDEAARAALLEAVVSGGIDGISAYRDRDLSLA